jgi:transposase
MNVTLFGYTLIETAKINNVDPQAWMPEVLEVLDPIADHKITRLDELVLWRYAQL